MGAGVRHAVLFSKASLYCPITLCQMRRDLEVGMSHDECEGLRFLSLYPRIHRFKPGLLYDFQLLRTRIRHGVSYVTGK